MKTFYAGPTLERIAQSHHAREIEFQAQGLSQGDAEIGFHYS